MSRWRKGTRRAGTVLQSAAHQLMQPFLNIVISALVIRQTSEAVWGEFIAVLIIVQLAAHIAAWGSRDYLLRAFSEAPKQIRAQWQSSLLTRGLLVVIGAALLALYARSLSQAGWLAAWLLLLVITSAFDVMIVYRKAFGTAISADVLVTVVRVAVILAVGAALTASDLIVLFTVTLLLKAAIYLWRFRDMLAPARWHLDAAHYRAAFPFFLLGFSGILASRIDLYTVSIFEPDAEVGRYQVFINLMLYLQAISQFILLPYLKTLYRMADASLFKVGRRLFALGVVALPPALLAAWLLLRAVYPFEFSVYWAVLGGLFVLPIYGYLPLIHRLYSRHEQNAVLWANVGGAGLNLAGNLLLLPLLGTMGALLSSTLMQWGFFAYYVAHARTHHDPALPGLRSATG
jgi:O-antigen/teichoic acid export membrane protein